MWNFWSETQIGWNLDKFYRDPLAAHFPRWIIDENMMRIRDVDKVKYVAKSLLTHDYSFQPSLLYK